jgi:hypothetical protein
MMWAHQLISGGETWSLAFTRETLRRAVFVTAFMMIASPAAFGQQQGVSLKGVFDQDLADVKQSEALSNAIKTGQKGTCYPPRIKTAIVVEPQGDPDFAKALANARAAALGTYLSQAGLANDQFEVSGTVGAAEAVIMTYGKLSSDSDRDPPKFKVLHSDPPKGTKVKPGDKIKIKIIASERYEDGHKSWPSGVRTVQLLGPDGLVDKNESSSMNPDPCATLSLEATYAVPNNPPHVIHLTALTEDAAGHPLAESADFPTVDTWKGTLHVAGEGNVYKDEADISLTFIVDNDGKISGTGRAIVTPSPRAFVESDKCIFMHSITPNTFDVAVEGRREADEFQLSIRPLTTATLNIRVIGGPKPECHVSGGASVPGMSPFAGIQVQMIPFRVPAKDHAQASAQANPLPGFKADWRLEISAAQP